MSDVTIVSDDYIVRHTKTDNRAIQFDDGDYVCEVITERIPLVRCQDCKYWVYNFNGCSRNPCTEPWYATDFCNYGERNE